MEIKLIEEVTQSKVKSSSLTHLTLERENFEFDIDLVTCYFGYHSGDMNEFLNGISYKKDEPLNYTRVCKMRAVMTNIMKELMLVWNIIFNAEEVKELEELIGNVTSD